MAPFHLEFWGCGSVIRSDGSEWWGEGTKRAGKRAEIGANWAEIWKGVSGLSRTAYAVVPGFPIVRWP
ncbi:hypothetical protein CUJ86_06935 [Methanofollis fontis]|uniref:Uncharacterized protein n=1 Tax=Methanofollis fontis TaxID=2052832 RepID=A0A483CQN6_9EURY|nr:hypothetical protein CUJ86_06935 [Methanofollis fontis]